jgi:hypothetical protein
MPNRRNGSDRPCFVRTFPMKTTSLKYMASILGLSAMAVTSPLLAQSQNGYSRDSSASTQTQMNEPAGAQNHKARNWSWLGLIGLIGLLGLRKHHEIRNEEYRTTNRP